MQCLGTKRSDRLDEGKVIRPLGLRFFIGPREPWVSLDVDFRACHAGEKKKLMILVFLSLLARAYVSYEACFNPRRVMERLGSRCTIWECKNVVYLLNRFHRRRESRFPKKCGVFLTRSELPHFEPLYLGYREMLKPSLQVFVCLALSFPSITSQWPTLSQYSLWLVGQSYSSWLMVLEYLVVPRIMVIGCD